jgi:hypothetical protein
VATSFRLVATIQVGKQAIGGRQQVFILRQVVRRQRHPTGKFGDELRPIPVRERFEFLDQLLGGVRHGISRAGS